MPTFDEIAAMPDVAPDEPKAKAALSFDAIAAMPDAPPPKKAPSFEDIAAMPDTPEQEVALKPVGFFEEVTTRPEEALPFVTDVQGAAGRMSPEQTGAFKQMQQDFPQREAELRAARQQQFEATGKPPVLGAALPPDTYGPGAGPDHTQAFTAEAEQRQAAEREWQGRPRTFMGKVGQLGKGIVKTGGEFALTGVAGASQTAALIPALGKGLLGKAATGVARAATRAAVRTGMNVPGYLTEAERYNEMFPDSTPTANFARAIGSQFLSNITEEAGEAIAPVGKALAKGAGKLPLVGPALRALRKITGGNPKVKALFDAAKYQGVIGEMSEEELERFGRALAGLERYDPDLKRMLTDEEMAGLKGVWNRLKASQPGLEDYAAQAVAFAIPGALGALAPREREAAPEQEAATPPASPKNWEAIATEAEAEAAAPPDDIAEQRRLHREQQERAHAAAAETELPQGTILVDGAGRRFLVGNRGITPLDTTGAGGGAQIGVVRNERGEWEPDLAAARLIADSRVVEAAPEAAPEAPAAPVAAPEAEKVAEAQPVPEPPPGPLEAPSGERTVAPEHVEAAPPAPPAAPPPAAGPSANLQGAPISITNAAVDEALSEMGRPPATHGQRLSAEQALQWAAQQVAADPFAGQKFMAQLQAEARPVSGREDALLLHEFTRLTVARESAEQAVVDATTAGDAEAIATAQIGRAQAQREYDAAADIVTEVGTENAIGLALRRTLLNRDFSLAAMERSTRVSLGGRALTEAERAGVAALHGELEDARKRIATLEDEKREAAMQKAMAELAQPPPAQRPREPRITRDPSSPRYGSRNRGVTRTVYDAATVRFHELASQISGTLPAALNPQMLAEAAKMLAFHIEAGAREAAEAVRIVVARVGEKFRPYIEGAVKAAQGLVAKAQREKAAARLQAGGLTNEGIGRQIQAIAKSFVAEGIRERDALIDAVHEAVLPVLPNITRRQVMDAISGYGDYKQLSKEEDAIVLRDLKGQMQQVGKLQDMAAGQAPRKTGVERRAPSDEERRLTQQVNEAKKAGGFDVTDPATQLRSALDAVKARLTHQIADLEEQIQTGQRTVKGKTQLIYDAEADALRVRRDALREQFDAIFGRRELTDEQRVRMAEAALEKSIAEYERRIKTGDLFPGRPASKTPTTPELLALRARRDALREELKLMRDLARPKLTPEQRTLQAYKTRTANQIADLEDKIARGDYAEPPKRKPLALDPEATRLKFKVEEIKGRFLEGLVRNRIAQYSIPRKIARWGNALLRLPLAIRASYDLSATLRQALPLTLGSPTLTVKMLATEFAALRSEALQFAEEEKLRNRPNAALYKLAKVEHTEMGKQPKQREEYFQSELAKYIPGVPASERAYTTGLNRIRYDAFDRIIDMLRAWTGREPNVNELRLFGNFANVATGRGPMGRFASLVRGFGGVAWAPRLNISRAQYLLLQPLWRGPWKGTLAARAIVATRYAKLAAGLGTIYGLAALYNAMGPDDEDKITVETNPRSADFLKLRRGRRRIDILGGMGPLVVFAGRVITGETKTGAGRIVPIRGEGVPFRGTTISDIMTRFARSKLAPVPGVAWNLLAGENMMGEPVTPLSTARDLLAPLAASDVLEAMQNEGIPGSIAASIMSILGFGYQAYGGRGGAASPLAPPPRPRGLSPPRPLPPR